MQSERSNSFLTIQKLIKSDKIKQKILFINNRLKSLNKVLSSNENIDQKVYKEYGELNAIVNVYNKINETEKCIEDAKDLIEMDSSYAEICEKEISDNHVLLENLYSKFIEIFAPDNNSNSSNAIIEIRPGVGGQEAALFGLDLFNMYVKYATNKKWKFEILELTYTEQGGIKEGIISVTGEGCYSKLIFESGTHRVQRVPLTESSGRVHTSAATVAIMQEPNEIDIEIKSEDIQIDTFKAQGAGGQHVNTTDSAVRITHKPTKIVAKCQDEKSQIKNREKAMKILRARVFNFFQQQALEQQSKDRKEQVGDGDRSEKIRTYNFPQSRVTDHRIGYTTHDLEGFLNGDQSLSKLIDAMYYESQVKKILQ